VPSLAAQDISKLQHKWRYKSGVQGTAPQSPLLYCSRLVHELRENLMQAPVQFASVRGATCGSHCT
jgi:hypothetical protein